MKTISTALDGIGRCAGARHTGEDDQPADEVDLAIGAFATHEEVVLYKSGVAPFILFMSPGVSRPHTSRQQGARPRHSASARPGMTRR